MISIIVAVAEGNAIGWKGELLCHLPDDLKHFKAVTQGHTVIMGERTFWSLPKHPLPNRRNIVLTDVKGKIFEGAEAAYSIEEIMGMVLPEEEAFIIGGGMVYRQFEPLADRLYITHIDHRFEEADTFFPAIDPVRWKKVEEEVHAADEIHPFGFRFCVYKRCTDSVHDAQCTMHGER